MLFILFVTESGIVIMFVTPVPLCWSHAFISFVCLSFCLWCCFSDVFNQRRWIFIARPAAPPFTVARRLTSTILSSRDQPNMYQFVESFYSHIFDLYIKFCSTSYRFYIISICLTVTWAMFTVVMWLQCTDDSLEWICKSVRQPQSRDHSIFRLNCECVPRPD